MTLFTCGAALSTAIFCAGVTGPLLWVKSWRLISARIRVSTPARVFSRAGWEPLADSRASRVAAVGGAATALVAAVKARMKVNVICICLIVDTFCVLIKKTQCIICSSQMNLMSKTI